MTKNVPAFLDEAGTFLLWSRGKRLYQVAKLTDSRTDLSVSFKRGLGSPQQAKEATFPVRERGVDRSFVDTNDLLARVDLEVILARNKIYL